MLRKSLWWGLMAACGFALLVVRNVASAAVQDDGNQEGTNAGEVATDDPSLNKTPKLRAYELIYQELRTLNESITRTLRAVPIGDPERRRQMMAEVEKMKARKQQLTDALPQAAIEAYIEAPDSNSKVTAHVVSIVREKLAQIMNPERYEPEEGYQLATKLSAVGTNNQALAYLAGRAAFVTHRFEEAEVYWRRAAELGAQVPEDTWQLIALTRERWQRELELRAADESAALPRVRLRTTAGDVVIELFEDQAPNTVARFLELVEKKFYDNMIFYHHRPGQFSVTGCRRGDGTTVHEYYIPDECGREDARHHFAGSVEMVTAAPNRASCQFAIVHQPNPSHDGKMTVFGRVIEGLDVVFKFAPVEPQMRFARPSTRIITATVERKRTHTYEVKQKIPFESAPRAPLPESDDKGSDSRQSGGGEAKREEHDGGAQARRDS